MAGAGGHSGSSGTCFSRWKRPSENREKPSTVRWGSLEGKEKGPLVPSRYRSVGGREDPSFQKAMTRTGRLPGEDKFAHPSKEGLSGKKEP